MVKKKNIFQKIYLAVILIMLYLPIGVLIISSVNASEKNKAVWGGFSLAAYKKLFHDGTIMNALYTTVILAAAAGFIATILGTLVCIGMIGMSKKVRSAIMGVTNIPMLNADVVTGIALMLLFTRFTELSFSTMMVAHITDNTVCGLVGLAESFAA